MTHGSRVCLTLSEVGSLSAAVEAAAVEALLILIRVLLVVVVVVNRISSLCEATKVGRVIVTARAVDMARAAAAVERARIGAVLARIMRVIEWHGLLVPTTVLKATVFAQSDGYYMYRTVW